jgi:CRP-like cAMP-binding protein
MNFAETQLFRGAEGGDLAALQALAVHRNLMSGESLSGPGQLPDAIMLIELGAIDFFVDGVSTPIATLASGQLIGHAAYFDREAARFSTVAREPTRLLSIAFSALDTLLAARPDFARLVYLNAARAFARLSRQLAHELQRPYF